MIPRINAAVNEGRLNDYCSLNAAQRVYAVQRDGCTFAVVRNGRDYWAVVLGGKYDGTEYPCDSKQRAVAIVRRWAFIR